MPLLQPQAAEVGEQPDDPLLRRVRLHQRVEEADLAGGAVVDLRPSRSASTASAPARPSTSLVKISCRARRPERERLLVRDEDVEPPLAQAGGALVEIAALVRREQRPGEIHTHAESLRAAQHGQREARHRHRRPRGESASGRDLAGCQLELQLVPKRRVGSVNVTGSSCALNKSRNESSTISSP